MSSAMDVPATAAEVTYFKSDRVSELKGPNGLAFSPDERYLYVGNWDTEKKVVMRYEVQADGSLQNGKIFFDMTHVRGEIADGVKVDRAGNLYVSGPGGISERSMDPSWETPMAARST